MKKSIHSQHSIKELVRRECYTTFRHIGMVYSEDPFSTFSTHNSYTLFIQHFLTKRRFYGEENKNQLHKKSKRNTNIFKIHRDIYNNPKKYSYPYISKNRNFKIICYKSK